MVDPDYRTVCTGDSQNFKVCFLACISTVFLTSTFDNKLDDCVNYAAPDSLLRIHSLDKKVF